MRELAPQKAPTQLNTCIHTHTQAHIGEHFRCESLASFAAQSETEQSAALPGRSPFKPEPSAVETSRTPRPRHSEYPFVRVCPVLRIVCECVCVECLCACVVRPPRDSRAPACDSCILLSSACLVVIVVVATRSVRVPRVTILCYLSPPEERNTHSHRIRAFAFTSTSHLHSHL